MKIIGVEPYDPDKPTWSEPEPATSFRTINGLPMYWCEDRGVVHVCEGADIHPDARVYWTLCGKDASAADLAVWGDRLGAVAVPHWQVRW
ncbi:hypothetical protein [Bradyrhizobium neotropicale]|uniref:hypothetical protein n=1 Tax=Bradyrhizobium neotropicale TaxID=1497615 RepID=UPI001AD7CB18|nr:hypothetical protein [Bradyrhizobium neotropicale]MBO4222010.1 hypothetical protein [Bradyrhizobium neotropicale]